MQKFSIIICTHNPNQNIFIRLLNALLNFQLESSEHEIIIVDNNSQPSISENISVQTFLNTINGSRLIIEKKPGLTAARIAGIKAAKYNWIIFFDDDNEPAFNYLNEANKAIDTYSDVGVWGPGTINVVYTEGTNSWLEKHKEIFQQRNHKETIFGQEKETKGYYPDGTGMVLLKYIALQYVNHVENGMYSLSDRKGKTLSSGGDLQIVLTATKNGFGVGRYSGLELSHNISAEKTTLNYISRLCFGVELCNYKAHAEVMNWDAKKISLFSYLYFLDVVKVIYNLLIVQKLPYNDFLIRFSRFIGQQVGVSVLKNERHPSWLVRLFSYFINR